ncbi:FxLYD domain-containing protein (plasmid) [Streptomyces sp. NBC_00853]|uniref:FxLYD domain-containing protein n=1 Tax=Streptomyces sp. NBC_00853 TaxID=2903681 RepID=UPI002F91ADAE|nr:FxLYD domain-containing protein [Streptomyces sp. NBC_00853]
MTSLPAAATAFNRFLWGFLMSQQFPPPGQQAPPGYGYPPPQPKKTPVGKVLGFGCLGIVGLVLIIGIAGSLGRGNDDTAEKASGPPQTTASSKAAEAPTVKAPAWQPASPAGAEADVKITGCEVNSATKWAKAHLTITNGSSKRSNYMISVEFVNKAGTRMGDAIAASNNLAPGQAAEETAQGLDQITGEIMCKVTKVTRYAS